MMVAECKKVCKGYEVGEDGLSMHLYVCIVDGLSRCRKTWQRGLQTSSLK